MFHTRQIYSTSRVGIHYCAVVNHLIAGIKPLLRINITLFHLGLLVANVSGYLFHIR